MTGGEIQNCNTDGVSIYAIGSGTSEFTMTGGTIEDNGGYGVWVDNGSAVMSGGSVKGSERYDIYIGSRATLTVNNTQVGGTVLNMGKITGQGSAEFTGTEKIRDMRQLELQDARSTESSIAPLIKEQLKARRGTSMFICSATAGRLQRSRAERAKASPSSSRAT